MKLLSILLTLCLSLNSFAATGTISELDKLIDEYQYAITVEWDQVDQNSYELINKQFYNKARSIFTENSFSRDEVLQIAENRIEDKKVLNALRLKLSLSPTPKSEDEALALMKEISKDFYKKGASWNGEMNWNTVGPIILLAVILFIPLVLLPSLETHQCAEWGPYYKECDPYSENPTGVLCDERKTRDCLRYEPIE